jgi:hypothetical protein
MGRFLRYKAHYRVAGDAGTLAQAVAWLADDAEDPGLLCEDAHDPRVLPLHLFAPKQDFQALDQEEGRGQFRRRFRHQGSYRDADQRPWQLPHADEMHGQDLLTIRQFELQPGFHWDVQNPKRPTTIRTPVHDYKLPRLGYANVRPNGRVAVGSAK